MLCQFSFQNFRSYKSETTFDFQAATLPEFKDTLITQDKASDLLPVAVVYGPNGGGKSNLLEALACLISTVARPVHELGKNRQQYIFQQKTEAVPFLYDHESASSPTEFRIYFRIESNEYCYYISLKDEEVLSESLYRKTIGAKRSATIFEREGSTIELGYTLSKERGINTAVNPKMPYVSFLAINYDIPEINEVLYWFESCIVQNYAHPMVEHRIMLSDDDKFKHNLLKALHDMDIDIVDYRYDEETKRLFTQRQIGEQKVELPFQEESEGTRKIIAALPILLMALAQGRLVIIDELDAKLHPKLLRYVIFLFKDKKINQHGAQLLFTSHDMYTLKNTVFRRDEIWFAAENAKHESEIYSLYEIRNEDNERVKNTAAYDKQYMEGRYGADPYLSNMLGGEFE